MDIHGYPQYQELRKIATWKFPQKEIKPFLDYLKSKWHWPDRGFKLTGKHILKLNLSTGGWSGNEDIIKALQKNWKFWYLCWVKSVRGGHYYFEIRPTKSQLLKEVKCGQHGK